MTIKEYDSIIISDLHLGSTISEARRCLKTLKTLKFKRLILLGDIFADLNFSRLNKEHWEFLSYLRELSNPKRNIEIVWVVGNHDLELQQVMSHLVGIETHDAYVWYVGEKKCIALHGHQFDPAMIGMLGFTKFISWWFLQIQKIPGFQKKWSQWIDLVTGHFQNLSSIVLTRAIKYAKLHNYDIIFCGHTHTAIHISLDGIDYYNSGCWVGKKGSYIAIKDSIIEVLQNTLNDNY
jgi:UDP-2,3-diacylglucosamine pyrophosphatase LpxH